jgi:hypothetical protein
MGIVLFIEDDNNKRYLLQPFYYMDDTINSLYILLKPFAESISTLLDACDEKERLGYTTNNLEQVFKLFIADFKQNG